ncbi:ABC transporter permease [Paramicrobacterium agarici]
MMEFRLPLGEWVEAFSDFVTNTFAGLFDVIAAIFGGFYDGVDWLLATPPFWVIMIILAVAGFFARGWVFAVGTVVGLLLILSVNQWDNAMDTLALTLVAAAIAVIIAIPVGIWAARSDTASKVIRPILDFLQTMPAFVYLIPAIFLFSVGVVPGVVATILFAVAPGVRLTELGIRGVDTEVVEAGHAFGASPRRILMQIQLPLARPSIMAGVNQVIMLSLSMVVIASMVGAPGLGKPIISALQSINIGLGFEAGLSVVILAILLDRLTATLGGDHKKKRAKPAASASDTSQNASDDAEETTEAGQKRAAAADVS